MKMLNNKLELLNQIQKQNPSPFLYNKILNKIAQQKNYISKTEMIVWAIPSCLAIVITFFILFNKIDNQEPRNLATELHLTEIYSLY